MDYSEHIDQFIKNIVGDIRKHNGSMQEIVEFLDDLQYEAETRRELYLAGQSGIIPPMEDEIF